MPAVSHPDMFLVKVNYLKSVNAIVSLSYILKFRLHSICSFGDIAIIILRRFNLKSFTHAHVGGFMFIFSPHDITIVLALTGLFLGGNTSFEP